ncbi:hypothetical protein [Heyndrickxia oleronia]|uniref:Uncharacterized protein n=1 Tax=Heyndrickxia oleronia TaxID=38875 RepID=A0AAW6SM83_9BACI|nr:hypothetical protein [Heyndrickxia oleronia]MDH5159865.1 hypothetical protein [Heyndrickxia oleronia]
MGNRVVKAKESSYRWGYEKGDMLVLTSEGADRGIYTARNLTKPGYGPDGYAIIHEREFKDLSRKKQPLIVKSYLVFAFIWAGLAIWNFFEREWLIGALEILIALLNVELYGEKVNNE